MGIVQKRGDATQGLRIAPMCATEHGVEKVPHVPGDSRHLETCRHVAAFARSLAPTDKDISHANFKSKCPKTGFGMCKSICVTPTTS